jgi:hypothetical protein
MSTCNPEVSVQEPSSTPPDAQQPGSCLLSTPAQVAQRTLSANRSTDARTALKRGLANYLLSLPPFIHPTHQRKVKLRNVFDVWPDQEDKALFPAASIVAKTAHTYDASSFTPTLDPACKVGATTWLVKYSEIVVNLTIDILTTDPEERICFGMQMEDALNPVDWMYGFQLELPHYHNLRGVYQLMDGNYPDTEADAFSRNRHLVYTLSGQLSVVRCQTFTPLTEVRSEVTVVDGNTDC